MIIFFAALSFLYVSQQATANDAFLWGVGHSAFQVEGSPVNSDWSQWTQTPHKITDNTNADKATRFWTDYEEDFKLAKTLGARAFRMSIAWERIEPQKDTFDTKALSHYEKIISTMRNYNLEPIITLHHFVLPAWLSKSGGLVSNQFPEEFTEYATWVVKRLALGPAQVKWWMTFNEPNVLVRGGYMQGDWPPGQKNFEAAVKALAQLSRAHIRAVNAMRKISPQIKIGIAQHWRDFQVKNKWNPLDHLAMWLAAWAWNQQSTDSMFTGKLRLWLPGGTFVSDTETLEGNPQGFDFFGLNYYGRTIVSFSPESPFIKLVEGEGPKSDIGWEIYPEGLKNVLVEVFKKYSLPVLIAENGLANAKDSLRSQFLTDHIHAMKEAQKEGVPVMGYLHWSLTDNFEWALGLSPRFGLVEYDYQTKKRTPRASFETYKQIILGDSIKNK